MSKDYTKELNSMYRLMTYGLNESKCKPSNQGIVEYSQLGADGKTYGILKEGTKYYVKVAPKKNTQVLAEDFDYVGGRDRRKAYDSYSKASNALNLQLISVNESVGSKTPVKSQYNLNESAEWKNTQTKEARTELNRFYQLVSNVDNLLNENIHYINENDKTYSEKPTKSSDKCSGPCGKQQQLGIKDKDWTKDNSKVDAEKDYNQYGVKGTSPSGKYNAANGIEQIDMTQGNPYSEKAKTSKEQGKTMSEGKRSIKLSEEQHKQVLAWRNDRAFVHNSSDSELDRSHGTEIGDTAPWNDRVNTVYESFDTTEWDDGLPTSAGVGTAQSYKKPFEDQSGVRQPVSETDKLNEVDDTFGDEFDADSFDNSIYNGLESGALENDPQFDDVNSYDELVNGISKKDLKGQAPQSIDSLLSDIPNDDNNNEEPIEGWDDTDAHGFNGFDDETAKEQESDGFVNEAHGRLLSEGEYDIDSNMHPEVYNPDQNMDEFNNEDEGLIFEVTLDDFGKHPAYRKKPMTLPQNADGSQWGEDWNDESAKGELPYGRQIGHSGDPFTDKVNAITNAVVTALSKKKN